MKCFGRTKTSNFRERCSRKTNFIFCWQHISAIAAIVVFLAAIAEFTGYSVRDLVGLSTPAKPTSEIKLYLSGVYSSTGKPKSDVELMRGERTLMFVSIPRLKVPANRFIFGTVLLRPVNVGSISMSNAQLTTIYENTLWDPALAILEQESITPISGAHNINFDVKKIDDHWISTRTVPRLDPFTGAPFPLCFLLEMNAENQKTQINVLAEGELEIRMFGPDWIGLKHIIDIRCIPSESPEDFFNSCKALAASLRSKNYPNVPVILADTGGKGSIPIKGGPMIIQANVDSFLSYKNGKLNDL